MLGTQHSLSYLLTLPSESNQPSSISNRVSQALDDSPERSPPDGSNMQPSPALHAQTEDVLPMEDIHDGSSALEVPASSVSLLYLQP